MSPPCRRAAALTSGDHPEPHPDLCSPPALISASAAAGLSALATGVHRASLSEGGGKVPTGAGWPQGSRCYRARETGGCDSAYRALGGEGRRAWFARAALGRAGPGLPGAVEVTGVPGMSTAREFTCRRQGIICHPRPMPTEVAKRLAALCCWTD